MDIFIHILHIITKKVQISIDTELQESFWGFWHAPNAMVMSKRQDLEHRIFYSNYSMLQDTS